MSVAHAADAANNGMLDLDSSRHTVARDTSRSVHHRRTPLSAMPMALRQLGLTRYSVDARAIRSRSSSISS